uniref:Zgc:112980 n=1 Tax=Gasterosteus aculeatus aculeatus TaxID=481459 RepID=A0AAQ4RMQ5_GASAC|nr:uncharacterized protein zgc:112980 [Gasterosteus aculeatus aculeatus]XP_040043143.1 uncharacterized protein zgc:112980 [Gasterosteus aculeatus aculeatus]
MGTAVDTGEVIVILSDDEDAEENISFSDQSVVIVEAEDVKKSDSAVAPVALDEDLVITFSRRAEVLPHARYDCPIHVFTATDEIGAPAAGNQLMCDQCFCYICDKLASLCQMWCCSGLCHCNSHKRSDFWNNLRNSLLLGGLQRFNLTLSELDSHLRHAETMLQSFKLRLSAKFECFLRGESLEGYGPSDSNPKGVVFNYTPVYEFVSSFLNEADQQEGRAAAVLRLGAAEVFIRHFQVSGSYISHSPTANAVEARLVLLQRVIASVQRQMVMSSLTPDFIHKLQEFYQKLFFPPELKNMKSSLCVRPWDDVLLVSVLKGQNVSGVRKDKGKKDLLIEQIAVVLLRTEVLQQQHRYRELCRYLRVVESDDSKLLQQVRDLIPFFFCMDGSLPGGLHSLFPTVNAPAARLTPDLFLFYLRLFTTATAPPTATARVSGSVQVCISDAAWQPMKDAVPLPDVVVVRFALRVQRCCPAVFADSRCWISLLQIVNPPAAVPEPTSKFLHEAKDVVSTILHGANVQIPRVFQEGYPDQALLLLVTGALGQRVLSGALSPALPVLNTFKGNLWALGWLWDSLSSSPERLRSFSQELSREAGATADGDNILRFLHSLVPAPSSSTEYRHQQSSGS